MVCTFVNDSFKTKVNNNVKFDRHFLIQWDLDFPTLLLNHLIFIVVEKLNPLIRYFAAFTIIITGRENHFSFRQRKRKPSNID